MCGTDYDSSDCDSSTYEESCSGICCPEYDYTLDCGCCPCKGIQMPLHSITGRPLITILTDEMRREIYSNMIDLTPWTSKYVMTNDGDLVENPLRAENWEFGGQRRKSPKKKASTTKKDAKPKIGPKKMKRTQTERTKARQMKKRQEKLNEISSKEVANAQVKKSFKSSTVNSISTEAKVIVATRPNQKKRPKTHFRKTKKPGRA